MRFEPTPCLDDPFVDAARPLILLDTFGWPAAFQKYKGADYTAPNLDIDVCFHQLATGREWLLVDHECPVAGDGLLGVNGRVWDSTGRLLASGSAQLCCIPRLLSPLLVGSTIPCVLRMKSMANVLCVLYDDPVDGYPPAYARDEVPAIDRYPDGQTTPTPEAIDFTPGELLGSVSGELGLREFLEGRGHPLVVTSRQGRPGLGLRARAAATPTS